MSDSTPAFPISSRPRRYGLGLRAQTLIALTAGFALCFSGLAVIVVSAARHVEQLDRTRHARALCDALASSLSFTRGDVRERALGAAVGRADIVGVELVDDDTGALRFGATNGPPAAHTQLDDGARLALWTHDASEHASPLGRLLRLYALITGGLILLLVYVMLTRLIVRPVEQLTSAVERLPRDAQPDGADPSVSLAGPAELVRLALAFNGMVRALRHERSALEERLRELEETTRRLRATQDQLIRSEKLAGVGRLAAGVAHEIGNPLAAILGLVELLQLGTLPRAEEGEFLARIRSETERIHLIIRDLLDYARTSPAANDQGTPPRADLERVVEEAVALIAPQKDLRRITIERRVHGTEVSVRASAHELTQIVLNLLLNAADAVGGEGHIAIELAHEGSEVRLTVGDSGPGVPAALRDKLFDPFFTTKPAGKGTGLGLAVCHAIVARLGGTIALEPDVGGLVRGARFTVRLPSAEKAHAPAHELSA